MWKQIVIASVAGAALLGGGAIALAADSPGSTPAAGVTASSSSTSPAPAPTGSTGHTARTGAKRADGLKQALNRLKNFDQGQWVTGPSGSTVIHQAIKGTVTAVDATSIQVKAADGTNLAFTAGPSTKVVLREGGKGSAKKGTIADVKTGDTVLVIGTKAGSSTVTTATAIADAGPK